MKFFGEYSLCISTAVWCSKTWPSTCSLSLGVFGVLFAIIFSNISIWKCWLNVLKFCRKAVKAVATRNSWLAQISGLWLHCAVKVLYQQGNKCRKSSQIIYLSNYSNYSTYTSWKLLVLVTLNCSSFCSTRLHSLEAILPCPWCRHAHKFLLGLNVA